MFGRVRSEGRRRRVDERYQRADDAGSAVLVEACRSVIGDRPACHRAPTPEPIDPARPDALISAMGMLGMCDGGHRDELVWSRAADGVRGHPPPLPDLDKAPDSADERADQLY